MNHNEVEYHQRDGESAFQPAKQSRHFGDVISCQKIVYTFLTEGSHGQQDRGRKTKRQL